MSYAGNCCWFCWCSLKYKKATKFNTYSQRTYLNFPGRKVLRNGLWTNFYLKIWDFPFRKKSKLFLQSLCQVCVKKTWNAVELVRFLKMNLNPVVAVCASQQPWKRMSKFPLSAEKTKDCQDFYCRTRVRWCKIGLTSLHDSYSLWHLYIHVHLPFSAWLQSLDLFLLHLFL